MPRPQTTPRTPPRLLHGANSFPRLSTAPFLAHTTIWSHKAGLAVVSLPSRPPLLPPTLIFASISPSRQSSLPLPPPPSVWIGLNKSFSVDSKDCKDHETC
ncbi:uncharacterized protein LOC143840835 [Paroedura picta]|uniref:uncharacterized protein LOC143840835 n=1 Tax=Paroedura picta TaxID=143630 RepID=UPI004055CE41